MNRLPPGEDPFDAVAGDYDSLFTDSLVGTLVRRAVWRHLDAAFSPGERVLELGCGTGEDAVHLARRGVRLLAIDGSARMVEAARAKLSAAGVLDHAELRQLRIEALDELLPGAALDGALSNFGALNCVDDLAAVARALSTRLRPGARVLACLMGRAVPWEWGWFLSRAQWKKAFRRFGRRSVRWRGIDVHYPSPRQVVTAFGPPFRLLGAHAVGALLPPSFAEGWARRHRRLVEALDRLERRLEDRFPLTWLADHVLYVFERREG